MKFADHLNKGQIRKFNQIKKHNDSPLNKKKEKLSKQDWLRIMGTNRDTYKRVNGAVRRR